MTAPDYRYEVQGEYVIPPDTRIPDSAASMAPMDLMGGRSGTSLKAMAPKSAFDQATGRWRLQVIPPLPHSPFAHVCILPQYITGLNVCHVAVKKVQNLLCSSVDLS